MTDVVIVDGTTAAVTVEVDHGVSVVAAPTVVEVEAAQEVGVSLDVPTLSTVEVGQAGPSGPQGPAGPAGADGFSEPVGSANIRVEAVSTTHDVDVSESLDIGRWRELRQTSGTTLALSVSGVTSATAGQARYIRLYNQTGGAVALSIASGSGTLVSHRKITGGAVTINAGETVLVILHVFTSAANCLWQIT